MTTPKNTKIYAQVVAKIKATVKRWPSAYASGMVVKEYKRIMAERGEEPYEANKTEKPLTRWFMEKWIDISSGKPCGSARKDDKKPYYPTCRPSIKISKKTPILENKFSDIQKEKIIKEKQIARQKNIIFPKPKSLRI